MKRRFIHLTWPLSQATIRTDFRTSSSFQLAHLRSGANSAPT